MIRRYYLYKYNKYGERLGFSIDYCAFGYGLVIPHYGTIVVGGPNTIGNYCVLHTSTCIAGDGKKIGNGFYLSSGSQVVGNVEIGDNVTIASHSLVNKNVPSNVLVAGSPSVVKKENYPVWFLRDGIEYQQRMNEVDKMAKDYGC